MRSARVLAGERTPPSLANFDSTTVFVRATASALQGKGFPNLGMISPMLAPLLPAANRLPDRTKRWLYARAGASEAVPPGSLDDVSAERIRRWVVEQYPMRGYPAIIVGSPNGAAVHLSALLGVPFLPQTFFLPVRRSIRAGDGRADLAWGRDPARRLLDGEPDLQLHHMHDPNQDRVMIDRVAYFRVKLRRLGAAYEAFLDAVLAPGGTVLLVECTREWPTTRVGDRHVFQFGGTGGLAPEEYFGGSEQVAAFRGRERRRGSPLAWNPPEPDGERPEAEWGFAPPLREDVRRVADRRGYEVRRLRFDDPADLSPLVAELYRETYRRPGRPADRLVVSSFALMDPWWTLRTGAVPYWATFTTERDVRALESYLDAADSYESAHATLFSHGVESAGHASIDRWRSALSAAPEHGFVGVDPAAYPLDYGSFVRYHTDLPRTIPDRHSLPAPPSLDRLEAVVDEEHGDVGVACEATNGEDD